jgi:ribokinase
MTSIIVCGSLNMDLVARVAKLPRAGETVAGVSLQRLPGGKGLNQAVAAARMGASVAMIGARGDDVDGATLAALLAAEGVDTRGVQLRDARTLPSAHTGLAQVIVAEDGENSIVVHGGANMTLAADEARASLAALWPDALPAATAPTAAPSAPRVALAQLETPMDTVTAFFAAARAADATTLLNPAPARFGTLPLLAQADIVVVNETELAAYAPGATGAAAPRSLLRGACRTVIVTLGSEGAWLVTAEGETRFPAPAVRVVDTTGAGDCFCGVLAAGLAAGLTLEAATARAVSAASLAVTRVGAAPSMPRAGEC